MLKELIISIVIVVLIVVLDFVTQDYTKETVKQTSIMLNHLKENIKSNKNNISDDLEKIFNGWEVKRAQMAYFIEHDELEKVETNLTNIKSYIEENELDMAISSIDEAEFILEHIKDKNAFNLENIF